MGQGCAHNRAHEGLWGPQGQGEPWSWVRSCFQGAAQVGETGTREPQSQLRPGEARVLVSTGCVHGCYHTFTWSD